MTHSRLRLLISKSTLVIVTALAFGWGTWHFRGSGVPNPPPPIARGAAATPGAVQALPARPTASPRFDAEAHRDRVQVLAAVFDGEAVDASWQPSAEAALRALYAGKDFDALRTQVQCKSSLCRVAFDYQDAKAASAAILKLARTRPWPGKAFTRHDSKHASGFSYLAREGMPLPSALPRLGPAQLASF